MSDGLYFTASRIASGQWTVGPEGAAEMETDEALAELVGRGYARLHYVTPDQQIAGWDDHWTLTPEGERWYAEQRESLIRSCSNTRVEQEPERPVH